MQSHSRDQCSTNIPVVRLTNVLCLLVLSLIIGSVLIPRFQFLNRSIGTDDLLCVPLVLLMPVIVFKEQTSVVTKLYVWFLLIIFTCLFSLIYGDYLFMGSISAPTEVHQYIKRFIFFGVTIECLKNIRNQETLRRIIILFSVIFIASMAVAILQIMGIEAMINLYSRGIEHTTLAQRQVGLSRTIGIAGISIGWGGFCILMLVHFAALSFVGRGLIALGYSVIAGLASVLATMTFSKSTVIALMFVLGLLSYLYITQPWEGPRAVNKLKRTGFVLIALIIVIAVVIHQIDNGHLTFLYRRMSVGLPIIGQQALTENLRYQEVIAALSGFKEEPLAFLFGLGKTYARARSGHVEVEFFYVLTAYGLIGVLLRYGLMWHFVKQSWKMMRNERNYQLRYIAIVMFTATLAYLVFTIGFFFWQEIVVGTTYWIFAGIFWGMKCNKYRVVKSQC